jgi:hypothetical protein
VSVRSEIAEALTLALPETYKVMAYVKTLDNTARPVVMVHRSKVARNSAHAYLDHSMTVHVLVAETLGEAAEDAADAALEAVLSALEAVPDLDWTEAERAAYENFTGYTITLTTTLKHTLGE